MNQGKAPARELSLLAECPRGHVIKVHIPPNEREVTFRCEPCKADYRLKVPKPVRIGGPSGGRE